MQLYKTISVNSSSTWINPFSFFPMAPKLSFENTTTITNPYTIQICNPWNSHVHDRRRCVFMRNVHRALLRWKEQVTVCMVNHHVPTFLCSYENLLDWSHSLLFIHKSSICLCIVVDEAGGWGALGPRYQAAGGCQGDWWCVGRWQGWHTPTLWVQHLSLEEGK